MFSFFRRGATAKIMLIILGLSVFAMVITGFGTGGSGLGGLAGPGSGTAVSVGSQKISAAKLQDAVNRALKSARAQRPELDMRSFLAGGTYEQILDELIAMAATRAFGEKQGLAVSKRMIDAEIANIPSFQNLAGQFDNGVFQAALGREKISEADLRDDLATRLIQRQLVLPAAGSAHVPQALAFQYASLLLERRSGSVGVVPSTAMGAGKEPGEAEIATFYRDNPGRYTIPERRVIRYVVFGREQIAEKVRATEAEIAAFYRQNAAQYAPKETRSLSQVVLPEEAAARHFAERIAQGSSFAQAASQAGFAAEDTALGAQSREGFARVSSPAVAAAAFAAAKGATTAPVRSELGWHVVRVDDITTSAARPLAEARAEIAAQIEQRKAEEAMGDLVGRIENALGEGSTLEEVARSEKLAVRETAPITATGTAPGTPNWQPPAELAPLLRTAFEMEPDEDPVVETIAANEKMAALAIARVEAAAPPPLAQIRDRVKADLVARRASDRAKAVASSIVSKINAGVPPARAFSEAGVALPGVQKISATRREIAGADNRVPPPLQMLFNLPRSKARILPAPNGRGWFVVHLESVVPGDAAKEPALAAAVRQQFSQVLGDEYQQQFLRSIKAELGIERNAEVIARTKQELIGIAQ